MIKLNKNIRETGSNIVFKKKLRKKLPCHDDLPLIQIKNYFNVTLRGDLKSKVLKYKSLNYFGKKPNNSVHIK
ncbi:hypothetical protein BpHYR1_040049 [Brachionus plicatilis]|uniref:Uncharacterized protein n=1 Tax=Brachionus plicatilis TaxID=10195 RepID=A0A3M7QWD7_BRAPC|nr:hypothetical protein BpHYR1_040049 [Brachionus plicatilis]